jgi:hypothetical protein
MALPSGHGEITAKGVANGPVAVALPLPAGRGQVRAQGSVSTPYTLVVVTPDGRAKLDAQGIVTSDVVFDMAMRDRGRVQARVPIKGPTNLDLILPEGRGHFEMATPISTVVRLRDVLIPEIEEAFNIDIDANGAGELAMRLPERAGEVRLRLEIAIPLAPLVRLACVQLERWVRVERLWLRAPHLDGAHDLILPLYVEARRGLLAKVEVVANLYIDPKRQQLQSWSVRAHGLNTTGSAVSSLYLNPGLLRQFNRQMLFDPATMLPRGATIHSLAFRSATRDRVTLVVEASFVV